MPLLYPVTLSTPREAKIAYALHETGAWLVGDRFLPSYLRDCLRIVEGRAEVHKFLLMAELVKHNVADETIKIHVAQVDDTIKWARETREQDYHELHTLAFLSEWSAQEAGLENVVAAILETVESSALAASAKFKKDRYKMTSWPWPDEVCLEIAQKLDQKAKTETLDGGWNITSRLILLFNWLGLELKVAPEVAQRYNEASMIRNVIVHRYGKLGGADLARVPHLTKWIGKTVPMTSSRFSDYHQAIVNVHLALFKAAQNNNWLSQRS